MRRLRIAGHPLHPALVHLPLGLLAAVPVWVTENNVNADFDKGGGISACNGTPFVTDLRGSSAFFAAWRPYVFSQLGKAGIEALYHWDFDADKGIISYLTPVGQAMLNRKVGDEVEAEVDGAKHRHRIEKIEPFKTA